MHRQRSIHPGYQYTAKEEALRMNVAGMQTPEQSGCEEAVIQALVRRHFPGGSGEILAVVEGAQTCFDLPQEHLQHEDVYVYKGHDADNDVGGGMHQCRLTKGLKPSVAASRLASLRAS